MKRSMLAAIISLLMIPCLCFTFSSAQAEENPAIVLEEEAIDLVTPEPNANELPDDTISVETNDGETNNVVVSVTDMGANGSDSTDDYPAFRDALAKARQTTGTVKVHIPAGTYYLDTPVPVFSNTAIIADEHATIIYRNRGGIMIYSNHMNEDGGFCNGNENCKHGGYTQIENVTIEGGTWDANFSDSTGASEVFQFRHGRNITIKNAVCKNAYNHFINISGIDTATVENVIFNDAAKYTGGEDGEGFWGTYSYGDPERYKTIEAIHIDYLEKRGEGKAYPLDGTASQNIRVTGCQFENVFAGIGTHHYSGMGRHTDNIEVDHNTFASLKGGSCVNAYGFTNLRVHDNVANKGSIFLNCKGSTTCEVNLNAVSSMADTPLFFSDGSTASVSKNTLMNASPFGIRGTGNCDLVINDNTINGGNAGTHGIYLSNDSSCSAQNNTISDFKVSGIVVAAAPRLTLSNNTISNVGEHGVHVSDSDSPQVVKNSVSNAQKKGIVASACPKSNIGQNVIASVGDVGIHISDCPNVVANGNKVKKAGGNGINVYDTATAVVNQNEVTSATGIGLKFQSTKNATAQSNTIVECKGNGIQISGTASSKSKVKLIGNTSKSTKVSSGTFDIRLTEHCTGCVAKNNVVGKRGFSAHDSAGFTETNTQMCMDVDLSTCKVTLLNDTATYKGAATKPSLVVKYFSAALTEGTDYKISSTFDLDKTTAKATITGKGHYSGTKTASYKIKFANPALKSVTSVNGGVKFTWSASKGAKKYRVLRKVGAGKWTEFTSTAKTSITDKRVSSGKKYTYSVRCLSRDGKRFTSGYNTSGIAVTYVATPVLNSTKVVRGGVKITWAASKGAAKYRVLRKAGSGKWATLANTTATSYIDKNVQAGKKYTYSVRCLSKNGKSYTSGYDTTGKSVTYKPIR